MSYSLLVAGTQRYFHLCGLCTFTVFRQPLAERLLLVWTSLHAISLATIASIVATHPSSVFFDNDPIGALTDIIQVAAPYAAHFTNLFEAWRTREMRRQLRLRLVLADQRLRREQVTICPTEQLRNSRGIRRYLLKALAMQGFCVCLEVHIILSIHENRVWANLWAATLFTMIINQSAHLLYVWHVDEVKWRLDACSHLLSLIDVGGCQLVQLAALRRYHGDLWRIADLINEAFGWCALTTVTANFVCLSVNLYWNYVALYFGSNRFWKESLMGSLPLIAQLWVLCCSCDDANGVAQSIGGCLHGIRSMGGLRAEIRAFSMQLRHLQMRFSGRGFFHINCDLFKGIIAAIATYMLIFIQFMPYEDIWVPNHKSNQTSRSVAGMIDAAPAYSI